MGFNEVATWFPLGEVSTLRHVDGAVGGHCLGLRGRQELIKDVATRGCNAA